MGFPKRFDVISKQLPPGDINIDTVVNLFNSLVGFLDEMKIGYEVFKKILNFFVTLLKMSIVKFMLSNT